MTKPHLSTVQLPLLAIGSSLMFPYTFLPILLTPPANQDVWILLPLAVFYLFILCAPILFLMMNFRNTRINDVFESIWGKAAGKIATFIIALFFVFCHTACLVMSILFIHTSMFPETPSWALLIFMLAPITYASWKGAGTIGRLATLIVPGVVLTIFFFFIFGMNLMDFSLLKPVLADSSLIELNNGAFLTAARMSEIFVFFIFAEFLPKDAKIMKAFSLGLLLFILVYLMMIIPVLTVLGPDLARHAWNPYFLFSKQIKVYDFIQRVESVSTMGWYIGVLMKLSLYNFMASYVLSGIFGTKSHKGFTVALSVFAFFIALIPIVNNTSSIVILRSDMVFPWITLPSVFVIPLLTVLVYLIKKIYRKLSALSESG